MNDLKEKIKDLDLSGFKGVDLLMDFPGRSLTTFKTNVKVSLLAIAHENKGLEDLLNFFKKNDIDYYIIGGGSNTLLADLLDNIAIVKLGKGFNYIEFSSSDEIIAGAAVNLGNFIMKSYKNGYNFSFLAGIPGTLGGALFGNAGSKNNSVCDFVEYIECLRFSGNHITREKIKIKKNDYGYRFLNIDKLLAITGAFFKREKSERQLIYSDIVENIKIKKKNQPLNTFNGGCFFKNPLNAVMSAAQFIETAGLKGFKYGNAKVSEKHANFLENIKNASAFDIFELSLIIKGIIKDRFNIDLCNEVNTIGFK